MIPVTTHPNSRKVTIYRTRTMILDVQDKTEDGPDFLDLSLKYLGPYLTLGSQQVGSGLTEPEIRLLLPSLIDAVPEDREFRTKVRRFYDNLYTKVPAKTGVEFETGLEIDNSKPVSADNFPINLMHYIKWRHALKASYVAKDYESSKGNQMYMFYISDPVAEQAAIQETTSIKDDATTNYFAIKSDPLKVDMMLTLLGKDPRTYKDNNQKITALREESDLDPGKFNKVYKLDNFEARYLVQSLINTGVFTQINKRTVQDMESKKIIGHSMEEAILEIQSKDNEQMLVTWKIKMQEGLKKSLAAKKRSNSNSHA